MAYLQLRIFKKILDLFMFKRAKHQHHNFRTSKQA